MFTLKVFHVYAQELENVYFNQYTKMVRNYTLNKQFCILLLRGDYQLLFTTAEAN